MKKFPYKVIIRHQYSAGTYKNRHLNVKNRKRITIRTYLFNLMTSFYSTSVFRLTLLLVLMVMFGKTSFARHIVGGEIFYECLGPGSSMNTRNYRLTMKIYRDCEGGGADFDNPAEIGIYSYIGGVYSFVKQIDVVHGGVTNLMTSENPCLILPPNVCVEETSYIINLINMPIIQGSYIASWQRCCRNNSINNIIAPHNTGATYTIEITEEAQRTCNNGPRFDEFPPIGICVNDPINFDHSATDKEGDEIIYEFCAPLKGGGPLGVNDPNEQDLCDGITPLPQNCLPPYEEVDFFLPNYSSINPLGVSSSLSINPLTGYITGTPNLTGQFVVGVCVKEYRNGILLSILRRDFQFNVVNCQSAVTAEIQADAVVNGKEFILNSCGNNTVTFINESQVEEFIQSYRWTFDINGTTQQATTRHATFTFPGVGNYTGRMIINEGQQCGDTAFISVNVFPTMQTDFEFDYDTCVGGPVSFTDLSSTEADDITDWDWDFGDQQTSTSRNPSHLYQIPGLHPVTLIATDNNECRDTMTKQLSYFPVPPLIIIKPTKYIACVPEIITFTNLSVPIDETYDINWEFGDGNSGHEISPSHEYTEEGVYTVRVDITSPIGCFTSETFPNLITMEASPTADFEIDPKVINSLNPTARFTDLSSGGATGWFWDFGGEGRSFIQHPTYTFRDTGMYDIMQVVFHPNGCTDTLIKTIDLESVVQFFLPNAFTPNFDGKNEVYKPGGLSLGVKYYSLTIWSRWGEELFSTSDPEEGWNGRKFNTGQEMPVGVYLCVLQYHDARNRVHELREFVTLVR
jgi:gliding motility-associated-like protein